MAAEKVNYSHSSSTWFTDLTKSFHTAAVETTGKNKRGERGGKSSYIPCIWLGWQSVLP